MRSPLATAAALLLGLAPAALLAHPGGLNSQGCHTNRSTGEYHCHRGANAGTVQPPPPGASSGVKVAPQQPQTLMATPVAAAAAATSCAASDDEVSTAVRMMLVTLGYLDRQSAANSSTAFREAIRKFQQEVFFEATGEPSGALLVRLAEEVLRHHSE